ncbi:Protein CNGC15c, partial [Mucuna pruriens]
MNTRSVRNLEKSFYQHGFFDCHKVKDALRTSWFMASNIKVYNHQMQMITSIHCTSFAYGAPEESEFFEIRPSCWHICWKDNGRHHYCNSWIGALCNYNRERLCVKMINTNGWLHEK